jgi:hypothetical protein
MGLCSSKDAFVVDGKTGNDALVDQAVKPAPMAESAGERDGDVKEAADVVRTRSGRFDLLWGHFRSFCSFCAATRSLSICLDEHLSHVGASRLSWQIHSIAVA